MADLGRISGSLLANNLVRQGVDLAFETSLLYLNVTAKRIGINTSSSAYDLQVAGTGTLDSTNLIVDTTTTISNWTISTNTINNVGGIIYITPNQASNPTIITPGVATSNLQASNNILANTVSNDNINISPNGTGNIYFNYNTTIYGNYHATGNIQFDGNIQIGVAKLDSVSSNIVPAESDDSITTEAGDFLNDESGNQLIDSDYSLGANGLSFNTSYVTTSYINNFYGTDLNITGNTISSVGTNEDINLSANGSGSDSLWYLSFNQNTVTNVWPTPTTNTQRSIIISPNGTGLTAITGTGAVTIPVGNNSNLTLTTAGQIRNNSSTSRYEGYVPSGLVSFTNLYDTAGLTYITPEASPGVADNTIRFVTNNIQRASITTTGLIGTSISGGNVNFSVNNISNSVSTNDLTVSPTSGNINLNTVKVNGNSITNPLNTAFSISATGSGYTKFAGTSGVVFPVGTTPQEPASPENATFRFNTDKGYGEIYTTKTGTWTPATGTSPVLTLAQVQDAMNLYAIIL